MKGWSGEGWTHQGPLLAYTTIRSPARAPVTRPAIVSVLSRPPSVAGGILVNSIDGPELVWRAWHPDIRRESKTKTAFPLHVKYFDSSEEAPIIVASPQS